MKDQFKGNNLQRLLNRMGLETDGTDWDAPLAPGEDDMERWEE